MGTQIVNFTILLFLLTKFAYKPILDLLENRRKLVDKGLKDAETAEKSLAKANEDSSKIIQDAYSEANKIIEEAKAGAATEAKEIVLKANDQADKVVARAQAEADSLKEKTLKEAKQEIAGLVTTALDKIISNNLDETTKQKLSKEAISNL